jgi:hypothetical protein
MSSRENVAARERNGRIRRDFGMAGSLLACVVGKGGKDGGQARLLVSGAGPPPSTG